MSHSHDRHAYRVAALRCDTSPRRPRSRPFPGTDAAPLVTDEPPPLGEGLDPNPVRLLAGAVANCLAASLLFALQKYRNDPSPATARIEVTLHRNGENHLRVAAMSVALKIGKDASALSMAERALAQCEAFCVVTQSVRDGIPVSVEVRDATDRLLHASGD